MNKKEMLERRAAAIAAARALLDKAEAEKRDFAVEEKKAYDQHFAEAERLGDRVKELERLEKEERDIKESQARLVSPPAVGQPATRQGGLIGRDSPEYRDAFCRALKDERMLNPEEQRALQSDVPTSGGYLVPPIQWVNELLQAVKDLVFIRQRATIRTVMGAESLGVPTLDANIADFNWTNELATGSEDTSMAFGKRELQPHPLAKSIKLSKKLLRQDPKVDQLVRDNLAYVLGTTQENAYLTGSGVGQPLGLFVASSNGIPATRDVSTGNTATEIRFDGLIKAKFGLKGQYWPRAAWLFHRDALSQITILKDGNGQYIWIPNTRVGEPEMLLGFPFIMSEFVPNTFTTGQYVGIVGDFSFYWIADALDMEIQVLYELYAATNQNGIIMRYEGDGAPVLGEAFARVKLA